MTAECKRWDSDGHWCYLEGGLRADICPGAIRSKAGNYYWTKDAQICKNALIGKISTEVKLLKS